MGDMKMKMKSAKNNVDTPTYTICVNIDLQYVNECVCVCGVRDIGKEMMHALLTINGINYNYN